MNLSLEIVAWTIGILLMIVGVLGTLLPFLPGAVMVLLGAGAYWLIHPGDPGISWPGFLILLALALVALVIDMVSSAVGAKWFGASRWGAIGAIVGGIVGLFFSIPGIILGPFLGAIAFELIFARKEFKASGKSGVGTVVGGAAGIAAKLAVVVAMIVWFFLDVLVIVAI